MLATVRFRFAAFVLVCAVVAAATGCTRVGTSAQSTSGRHAWTKPNVLRIADIADPDKFNPLLSTMDLVEDLSSLVMSYLVIADGHGRLIGDLALGVPTRENGGISPDGRTYTYRLHRGVLWHDGKPFTSRDVAFTWRAIVNPKNNVMHREGYDRVRRIDTPDDATIVVHLDKRYPPFVTKFFTPLQEGAKTVLPEHVLGKLANINDAPFNAAPVGTGPFRFVRWDRGRGIEFAAFDRYFKGRPKIDRIAFTVVPDDNTIFDQMKSHEVDMVVSVPTTLYDAYRGVDGVTATLHPWNAENVFIINNARPGLRHLEVRRAVAMAIDYDAIIGKVTHGVGTLAHDIVPPGSIGYTNNAPYRYDAPAAVALLERNGWRTGRDGIREKAGERLDFTMSISTGSANARNIGIQVQRYLHDVGMNLTLKQYPYNVIFSYDGPIETRRYDFADYSYTLPFDPDNSVYLDCDQLTPKGQNAFAYCDKDVDAGERAGLATDDVKQRDAIYHRVEARIHETIPYIPLYVLRRPEAHNSDLRNFDPAPGIASWWNAFRWEI